MHAHCVLDRRSVLFVFASLVCVCIAALPIAASINRFIRSEESLAKDALPAGPVLSAHSPFAQSPAAPQHVKMTSASPSATHQTHLRFGNLEHVEHTDFFGFI